MQERCLEVLNKLKAQGESYDIVVNIQGDEPFIEAHHIDEVAKVSSSRHQHSIGNDWVQAATVCRGVVFWSVQRGQHLLCRQSQCLLAIKGSRLYRKSAL